VEKNSQYCEFRSAVSSRR